MLNNLVLSHIGEPEEIMHHGESVLLYGSNLLLIIMGIVFINKLMKQKATKKLTMWFGLILILNYVLVFIFGGIEEILG